MNIDPNSVARVYGTSTNQEPFGPPMLLTDYDVEVFHELNEFHIARAILKQLGPAVTALGDIVCQFGLEDVVAASLLHKHFNITENERVVRNFVGRTAYIKPIAATQPDIMDSATLPYLWQYSHGKSGMHFYPLEFCTYHGIDVEHAASEIRRVQNERQFLEAFGAKLWSLGLEDVFGIALLYSRTGVLINEGEALLETTDVENRILTLAPVDEHLLAGYDTTETLWIFSPPNGKEVFRSTEFLL